ncbi:Glia maturation factor gamma [Gonioctena quinquepunctata]|nr:Glia maturation factor gamma [Gonioctena quinquepunctata]
MSGGSVNICEVTPEVKQILREFRFRKSEDTAAIVLKVDREKQQIILDEQLEGTSIEDLQESLPSHQPRYIVLSYRQEHKDGRISYPLCFIFFTPRDSHAELQMIRVVAGKAGKLKFSRNAFHQLAGVDSRNMFLHLTNLFLP